MVDTNKLNEKLLKAIKSQCRKNKAHGVIFDTASTQIPVVLFNDDDLYVDYVYGIAIIDKALFVLTQRKVNGYCYEYGDDYFDESRVLSKKEVAELSDYLIPFDTVYDNWENYFSTIETLSLIEYYTDKQINFNNLAT